jgi:CheY-like chemotaxis protein
MMLRILICDDDAPTRELVAAILGPEDYEMIFAENGAQALELARESHPDVIMLDLMMPHMDGITACHALKDDVELAGIPVLI